MPMTSERRVLVADDNTEVRHLFKLAFEAHGFIVDTAFDGTDAIARLERAPLPELVVMDMDMPEVSGLEVLAWARGQAHLAALKIIIVTGDALVEGVAAARQADVCLVKPIPLKVLLDHARRLLQNAPRQP